jgi:hypothetical protein
MKRGSETMSGRLRWTPAVLMCSALLLTSCVSTKGSTTPTASASITATVVAMGKAATTPAGNTVVVHSYLSPLSSSAPGAGNVFGAADVEACAGPNASSRTGVASNLFAVQTPDGTGWPSVTPVKKPELKATYLAAKQCERGWVTFLVPAAKKPAYVVLLSSAVVKWKIP